MLRNLLLSMTAASLAFAVEDTEVIRQTYPAAPKLEIHNINGSVRVTGSNTSSIQLVATKRIAADDQTALAQAKSEVRLDVQPGSDRLRICVVYASGGSCPENQDRSRARGSFRRDYDVSVDLELQVPSHIELDLHTVNGGVTATGTQGAFQVKSVNGGVTVKDVDGAGSADTVNGAVSLSFTNSPKDAIRAKTVNGSIDAAFPKNLNANLNFKTSQGDVFTNFPATAIVNEAPQAEQRNGRTVIRARRNFGVRVNGGGPEMQFQTTNGNIQVSER